MGYSVSKAFVQARDATTKTLDPLDVTGTRADAANKKSEEAAADQKSQIQKYMDNRPQYQGTQNADGSLQAPYSSGGPKDNTGALDKKLNARTKVTAGEKLSVGANFGKANSQLDKNAAFANSTDPSAQAKAQGQLADQQQHQQQQSLTKQGMNNNQANQNAMAQQGGMSGGARERMNTQANRQALMGGQGLAAQNMQAHTQIAANDAANKQQMAQALPGQQLSMDQYGSGLQAQNNASAMQAQGMNLQGDLAATNAWAGMQNAQNQMGVQNNQFNAAAATQGNQAQNQFNQNVWQTQGQVMGANATADAQGQASKQKGFLDRLL